MKWDSFMIETLRAHRGAGLSMRQCAKAMDLTIGSVTGGVQRHIYKNPYSGGKAYKKKHARKQPQRWREDDLIETWEQRKLRQAREAQS